MIADLLGFVWDVENTEVEEDLIEEMMTVRGRSNNSEMVGSNGRDEGVTMRLG